MSSNWTMNRVHGIPVPIDTSFDGDGYGSIKITTAATAAEYDLKPNSVYAIAPLTEDVYIALLSLDKGESSISADTGLPVQADSIVYITTSRDRHVLSIIAGGAGTCHVVRMLARDGR